MFVKLRGVTFIEMLVALAINTVLLLAITTLFGSNFSYFNQAVHADILTQQLQLNLNLMANEIRRAGFWSNASTIIGSGTNTNPFMVTGSTDITITGGNCILFTYDYNKDGSLPAIAAGSNDERFGFRLVNQILQTRPPGATFACNAATNNWENITNTSSVEITALSFTLNQETVPVGAASDYMIIRRVDISITGRLTEFPTVTKTLTEQVRIRNDKYVP
jgi:prepilin peptidase dependent protein B